MAQRKYPAEAFSAGQRQPAPGGYPQPPSAFPGNVAGFPSPVAAPSGFPSALGAPSGPAPISNVFAPVAAPLSSSPFPAPPSGPSSFPASPAFQPPPPSGSAFPSASNFPPVSAAFGQPPVGATVAPPVRTATFAPVSVPDLGDLNLDAPSSSSSSSFSPSALAPPSLSSVSSSASSAPVAARPMAPPPPTLEQLSNPQPPPSLSGPAPPPSSSSFGPGPSAPSPVLSHNPAPSAFSSPYPMPSAAPAAYGAPIQGQGFGQQPPAPQIGSTPGRPFGTAAPGGTPGYQPNLSLPPNEAAQPPDTFLDVTLGRIPRSTELLEGSGMPLAVVVRPMHPSGVAQPVSHVLNAKLASHQIPVINPPSSQGIIRCRRCRSYINPFVSFTEAGRRWKCNLCYLLNDVPPDYYSVLSTDGLRHDHHQRLELNHGLVEFVAPADYIMRPPQAPIYVFVIDVSYTAQSTGMVKAAVEGIRSAIDHLAQNPRTLIAFLTVSDSVHFYNLRSSLAKPQMLVVPEVETMFSPLPHDLLVNLKSSRHLVDELLNNVFPSLFFPDALNPAQDARSASETKSAFGPAIITAYEMAKNGGNVLLFHSDLPSLGAGALKPRAVNVAVQDKDTQFLLPVDEVYKNLALEANKRYVCFHQFFFSPKFLDVATLAELSHITGGHSFYYDLRSEAVQAPEQLQKDVKDLLTREQGFEAVIRIRCSSGISLTDFHGNFFVRNRDLLCTSTVDSQQAFTAQMKIEDPKEMVSPKNQASDGIHYVSIQVALLYTTFSGERRIRVITKALPVTQLLQDVFQHARIAPLVATLSKLAIKRALESSIPKARDALREACVHALAKHQEAFVRSHDLRVPDSLQQLPLLVLALLKHSALRPDSETNVDLRVHALHFLRTLDGPSLVKLLSPSLYSLATLASHEGLPASLEGSIVLPQALPLGSEHLDRQGVYLLDTGFELSILVGGAANPQLLQILFDSSKGYPVLARCEHEYSHRVNNMVEFLIAQKEVAVPVVVYPEGQPGFYKKLQLFVLDRSKYLPSYNEFIRDVQRLVLEKCGKK